MFRIPKNKPTLKNRINIFLKILFSICVLKFNMECFCFRYFSPKAKNKNTKDKYTRHEYIEKNCSSLINNIFNFICV